MKTVYFKKLDSRAVIPQYATSHSAGMDLYIILNKPLIIDPGEVILLSTGLAMQMAPKMEAQIRPRSGLSLKYPNYLANSPGTIDSDYRGEIKIPFVNNSATMAILGHHDRVAQMIFSRLLTIEIEEREELEDTQRSDGGFGHTGMHLITQEVE